MKRFVTAAIGTCFLLSAAGWAQADTIALQSFTPGLQANSGSDQLYGWEFTVTSPVVVTALGVGDISGNPLSVSHDVGIFSVSDHSLLASTTVPAGNSATLEDGFRYVGLGTALTLTSGQYIIEMTMPANNTDLQSIFTSNVVTASPIQYVTSEFGSGSSLAYPSTSGVFLQGLFGPNFQFAVPATIPEPSTFALLALGGIGLAFGATRRKFVTI